ncbi:unnamed protein product [Euphydryas editha]|uniref:Regulatory protein zeste n=1 Tax=Euphydryas editha TaxID=104508 RepID=A0AAU9TM04_EUPED|nr:unnamed protein product [Euphydryas editha]
MRTSATQFELMVHHMEKNGDLSKPTDGPQGRIKNIKDWIDLTLALNADGTGDKKTAEKWRKVWSDLKNNTKKKAARLHKAATGTGGGPAVKMKLNSLELRILNIIGSQAAKGMAEVMEIGLHQDNPLNELPLEPQLTVVKQEASVELSTYRSQPSTSSVTVPGLELAAVEPQLPAQPVESQLPASVRPEPPAQSNTPPLPPTVQASPRRRFYKTRRRILDGSPRTSRPATQSKLARIQFSRSDAEWRAFYREKERHVHEIEKERLRLREIELQQQARWQELFGQFLSIGSGHSDTAGVLPQCDHDLLKFGLFHIWVLAYAVLQALITQACEENHETVLCYFAVTITLSQQH